MNENIKMELNKTNKEAFDKWFERGWDKEHLEKEFLRVASLGYSQAELAIEIKDNSYETSRRSDPRFIEKLKDMFPTLEIGIKEYTTREQAGIFPTKLKEVIKKRIVFSWEDENE